MSRELIGRLRLAANVADGWDLANDPPLGDWANLMDEAADKLEALEDDMDESTARSAATESLERLARSE